MMRVPSSSSLPLPGLSSGANTQWQTAIHCATLTATVMTPGLLAFGVKAVSTPVLWLSTPWLLVPELVLIIITMTASLLALLAAPSYVREMRAGSRQLASRDRLIGWLLLAFSAATAQIAWALMVSSFTCGG